MRVRPALLCDADGNLFPSEEPAFVASADVTNAFLAAIGSSDRYTAEELRLATTGKNFRTTAADLARTSTGSVLTELPPEELQRWVDEERRQVTAYLGSVLQPDPDVLEPLSRLASRYQLAAVSSSALARLAACFTATGLDRLIPADVRVSAEDSLPVPTSKPDPAVYLFACAQLGVGPADAVAVEDSVPGAQSAVAAGIRTVGNVQFVPEAERAERVDQLRAAGASDVVSSWSELERLLAERQS
jgi:beta-phosphoglucomutase-like phosphatase (HAD superfamily)